MSKESSGVLAYSDFKLILQFVKFSPTLAAGTVSLKPLLCHKNPVQNRNPIKKDLKPQQNCSNR